MAILESADDQAKIKNTTPGRTTFTYNGSSYRLDGYLLMYTLTDGTKLMAFADKSEANGVHGAGVAGCTAYIKDIKINARETPWEDDIVKQHIKSEEHLVNDSINQRKLRWIRSLMAFKPDGTMTPETLEKIRDNRASLSLGISPHSTPPYRK